MVQYVDGGKTAIFDGHSFALDKKSGYYICCYRINGKRKRLHVYVWEKANGPVPKGFHVHHKDENKSNNSLENLEILTESEHHKLHAKRLTSEVMKKRAENISDEERKRRSENVVKNAVPAAKEWHGTKEGKEWHSKHASEIWETLQPVEYTCTYCGKKFFTKNRYNKDSNTFCSNKCKSAYRRKLGVDDVKKVCEICGKEYIENKYKKTIKCPDCRIKRKKN